MSATDTTPVAPARFPWARTFYWSVRRELWEHRAVWIAPTAVAVFAALLHFVSAMTISDAQRQASLDAAPGAPSFMSLYGAATMVVIFTGFVVALLYSLDALQGERRDRSILFWKSLPVSDRMTVLAKAFVPTFLLPLLVLALVVAQSLVMATLQTGAWLVRGFDPALLWARLDLPFLWLCVAYGTPFMGLWMAPVYAWFLTVSAWARHAVFLWAVAPLAAVGMVQRLFMVYGHAGRRSAMTGFEARASGVIREPYTIGGDGAHWLHRPADLDPLRLYTLPGLWIGLAVAALLLFLAIRLRRRRAPN
jgi:ABC-2 type transport system permease protein